MSKNDPAERTVRDIRRKTRKQYTAEEKIRIVVSGLRAARRASPATPGAKRPRARLKACARRCPA